MNNNVTIYIMDTIKRLTYSNIIWLILIFLFCNTNVKAFDFKVDGICYTILDNTEKTVGVTYETTRYNSYSGDISIPNIVTNNGVSYSVIRITQYAFYNCKDLVTVQLPESITAIEQRAYCNCEKLSTINIPNGVGYIGPFAFYGCKSLTSINIPTIITTINESTFERCISLNNIEIPYGVTTIGIRAFSMCSSLSRITIPGSVQKMETYDACYAFSNCTSLKDIVIENGVSHLGNQTFSFCSNVETVTCKNKTPISVNNSFKDFASNATLYVPKGCKSTYANSSEWNEFSNR